MEFHRVCSMQEELREDTTRPTMLVVPKSIDWHLKVSDCSTAVWISCSTPHYDHRQFDVGEFPISCSLWGLRSHGSTLKGLPDLVPGWSKVGYYCHRGTAWSQAECCDCLSPRRCAKPGVKVVVFFLGQGWCHMSYVSSEAVEWVLGMVWDC